MLTKLLSGRYLMTIAFSITYCLVIIGFCILAGMGKIKVETLLAIFTNFATLVALIANWYFKRDRKKEEA